MVSQQQSDLIEPVLPPPEKGEPQEVASPDSTLKLAKFDKLQTGLEEYQMTEAVQQALDSGLIRNQAAKFFLPALCQLRETDLRDARAERKLAQTAIDTFRNDYHNEHTNRLVLQERLNSENRVKGLQNIFITLGGILFGCGLAPLLTASPITSATIICTIIGIIMLLVGWLYPENKNKS